MPTILQFSEINERSGGIDQDYVRTYERTFKVVVDDPQTGPKWIIANVSPHISDAYNTSTESDTAAIVQNITLRRDPLDDLGKVWVLSAPYGPWDPYRHASSPLNIYPHVTFEGVNAQRLCEVDYQGDPLLNTAYDNYDPIPEVDDVKCVIRVKQNLSTFSPATIFFYSNLINSDTWFGMVPHTVKCDPPKGTVAYHQACGSYWEVEWSFLCNPNQVYDPTTSSWITLGWDKRIPSRGYRQLVSGSWQKIVNADGSDIDQAAFLSSAGAALTPPVSPTNIVFTTYQVYRSVNFGSTFGFTASGTGALFF
jgi:hypothetical protein